MLTRPLSYRRIAVGFVCGICLLTILNPMWARDAGLDAWNLPYLEEEVREGSDLSKQLQATDAEIQQRILVKDTKIDELIAGRLTLAEVTDDFLTMNQARPDYMLCIRNQYAGQTDREKMARNVIEYARSRVDNPSEEAAVLSRLDTELNEMLSPSPAPLP